MRDSESEQEVADVADGLERALAVFLLIQATGIYMLWGLPVALLVAASEALVYVVWLVWCLRAGKDKDNA